ncbi:MAG TPA: NAD(P)H-dependent glycerol-3-phosphate dehydrogenase [Kiritimatiellia bacterium]|nr:NAD(P)H-dependent glycerol-3-phosphate dehydrogenase [Kiritimatiellia bacterium]
MNTTQTNITVLGDGGWGTALALILLGNGHRVTLWGAFPGYIATMKATTENPTYLPGVNLPETLDLTADPETALARADGVLIAVPSKYFRTTLATLAPFVPPRAHLISVSKGLDPETRQRLSQVALSLLGRETMAVLSGPSHAEEAARGSPTAVTVASTSPAEAEWWQNVLTGSTFRVYTATDVIGVELGGALKNIIALAAGICDGLGFGDNTKAALMTRGLAEITRFGTLLGADPTTFSGLSGIGDLMVTGMSRHSRNRSVGERIGKGESIDTILGGMSQVAEGVWTAREAASLARSMGVTLPICQTVVDILDGKLAPAEAVKTLMDREPKPEFD